MDGLVYFMVVYQWLWAETVDLGDGTLVMCRLSGPPISGRKPVYGRSGAPRRSGPGLAAARDDLGPQ
jgi:hypothetical protein